MQQNNDIVVEGNINIAAMAAFFFILMVIGGGYCFWKQDWTGAIACAIAALFEGAYAVWQHIEQKKEKARS